MIRQLGNDPFGDGNLGEAFDQFPNQLKGNKYCCWFELENPSEILKKAGSDPYGAATKQSKGKRSIVSTNYLELRRTQIQNWPKTSG